MVKILNLSALLALALFLSTPAKAQVLVIQASDLHSQYDHLVDFVKSVSEAKIRFHERYPNGKTLFVLNGDIAGPSEWSDRDKGLMVFKMLAHLSNDFDGFILTPGNHDGWSFAAHPTDGNDSFLEQTQRTISWFKEHSKHSGRFSAANLVINDGYQELFQDGIEIKNSSGERIRVVGLLLQDMFKVSGYDPNLSPNPIQAVSSMLEAAKLQTKKAAAEGVDQLIFAAHEGNQWLKKNLLPQYLEWKNNHPNPKVRLLKLPVFFAAHTHLTENSLVENLRIIESGSRYKYSQMILADSGALLEHRFMDYADQKDFAKKARLSREAKQALDVMKPLLKAMTTENNRVVIRGENLDVIRKDLRAGPHWMGMAIAESLRITAEQVKKKMNLPVDITVGAFSSAAFRRDEPVLDGRITKGHLKSIHPLPRPLTYIIMDGGQLTKLLQTLRDEHQANGDYSPQLAPNIFESQDGIRVSISHENLTHKKILVVFDAFLGWQLETQERYREFSRHMQFVRPETPIMQNIAIAKHFRKAFELPEIKAMRPVSCSELLVIKSSR